MTVPEELRVGGRAVAWLHDGTALPPEHSPRPYVHPIRSPSGLIVTDVAPFDHPWHAGLSLAIADVGGDNFWGGNTFLAGHGYALLDDHGRMDVEQPVERLADGVARFCVVWRDRREEPVVRERRVVEVASTAIPDAWRLAVRSELTNVTGAVLPFGSPGTRGRPDAGYGGWTLRLAPRLTRAEVLTSEAPRSDVGEHALGRPARWVCYRGADLTILLVAGLDPHAGADLPPWYVRVEEFPVAGPAPFFRRIRELAPDATMELALSVVVADGRHDAETLVATLPAC